MSFENDSVYGFMDNDYQAPTMENYDGEPIEQKPPRERTVNQFANRAPDDNKYNNKTTPVHAKESLRVEQKNESDIAYWRMFTRQIPKGEFENSVNVRFGGRDAISPDFRGKKIEYVELYKSTLGEWNNGAY